MSDTKVPFVLIHGAWHNAATWRLVKPLLEARGHTVRALDLPGAGSNARVPLSYQRRPLDATAFATEPSPNTATQEQRTHAVTSVLHELARETGRSAALVGHSLGGVTITAAAEAVPENVHVVVYVASFLLPNGMTVRGMMEHPTMAASQVPSLFLADPARVGAMRIDPRSDRPDYWKQLKTTFYGDMSDAHVASALSQLHCDEPSNMALTPGAATLPRFGNLRRHYVRCSDDNAITLAAQDFMISAADDALGGSTCTHTLAAAHSPFYSQTDALADILLGIARET